MNVLLSPLQRYNLRALELQFSPDAVWCLTVDYGSDGIQHPTVRWSDYQLKPERLLLAQRLITSWWTPTVVNGEGVLSSSSYRQLHTLIRVLTLIDECFPAVSVSTLTKDDWGALLVLSLYRVWAYPAQGKRVLTPTKKPLRKQTFERVATVLNLWFDSHQSGEVGEGPELLPTAKAAESLIRSTLQSGGHDFEAWKKGGSYKSVPFVIAHLLLADALRTVQSTETRMMLAFFKFIRESEVYCYLKPFWNASAATQIGKYKQTGDITVLTVSAESDITGGLANRCKEELVIPLHKRLSEIHAVARNGEPFSFPWRTLNELTGEYNRTQAAIYIVFLSVMGKRGPSEVRTLTGGDFTRPDESTGQDALVRPSIWKTKKGMRQEQGVTNFIDDVIEVAMCLGFHDKTNTDLPIFCALPSIERSMGPPKTLSTDRAQHRLKIYYDEFCCRMSDIVDFDIKTRHGSISSHQFRHTFAEFALRKFDGNVEELLRQHFCHRYNHWWTKRYTEDKLDVEQANIVNRRYIRELVPQILLDSTDDPEYVGAVALFIKKRFGDDVQTVPPLEVEEIIEQACDEVVQVTAHEYGWCLLHNETYSVAKCRDANGSPNPAGTTAKECLSCANFCASRKSHLATQTRILINHIDFLEQDTWKLPRLKYESRQTVRHIQSLFPQLNDYGKV